MGAGKSTVGAAVARRIGRRFVDLDDEIERASNLPIAEFFRHRGEVSFRELERRLAAEALAGHEPIVLSLGGGAVLSEQTRLELRERALCVLLDVSADEAWSRVAGSDRPLVRDEESLRALYRERRPIYLECADAVARDEHDVYLAAGGVHVGRGSIDRLGELIPGWSKLALLADSNVARLHGAAAQAALRARLESSHELPVGEAAKTLATAERLWGELRLERGGTIVALGGGCTLDAGGFVASAYLRGIDWVSVPSNLLAQVDAGIGGKTALNLPQGKNLIGTFHWPVRTVIDPDLLATLPEHERQSGLAEVVKTGLLAGELVWHLPDAELVRRCAAFKTAMCLLDPYEQGPRAALNLGHTFAHALEAAGGYAAVSHGRAVALGLVAALRLSSEYLGLDPGVLEEVTRVLGPRAVSVDRELAWVALHRDKKVAAGTPKLVLLERPGQPVTGVTLPEEVVRRELDLLIAG
jgi:shikimate kinase/3-dehydroquinate synthase